MCQLAHTYNGLNELQARIKTNNDMNMFYNILQEVYDHYFRITHGNPESKINHAQFPYSNPILNRTR